MAEMESASDMGEEMHQGVCVCVYDVALSIICQQLFTISYLYTRTHIRIHSLHYLAALDGDYWALEYFRLSWRQDHTDSLYSAY